MKLPLKIGHRGAAGLAPENTLSSIQMAMDFQMDRIELDLRQTLDGVVVVLHDKTINRTTTGRGQVANMTYNRLRKYSAGSKFSFEYRHERVPSFKEVLELVNGKCKLLLEIKQGSPYHPGIEKNIIKLILEYNASEWCIVQSFNDSVLKNFRKLPELQSNIQKLFVAIVPIAPYYGGSQFSYKKIAHYDFAEEFNIKYQNVTPLVVKRIHEMGKKINVWTVNDSFHMEKFTKMGVDGIITNYPDRLNKVLEKL